MFKTYASTVSLSDSLSNLHVCNICPLVGANKKVMKIRREKMNEHVLDVNCYISKKRFSLAWVPY
jgi:hypothetical protein